MLDEKTIQSWTAEELIKEVWHELTQKSSLALTWAEVLAIEDNGYGFSSDEQKDALLKLKKEIEIIRFVTDWMLIWHQGQKGSA
ncbi:MAG: hypothetical protein H6667_12790 [Ardenticatenaceae bacterium]|nr:hypothetical protein [Ardenticatenaceae bacterium]